MHHCASAVRALCRLAGRLTAVGVCTCMLTASSIGAAKGGGYARYLESKTVEPERGDYYLNPSGEPTQAPGRWLASPETLARLGIDGGAVDGPDFIALMEGRHPRTGGWLRAAGATGARGGGIDLTFSAPKSVSAVWALGDASPASRHGGRARRRGQRGDELPDRDGARLSAAVSAARFWRSTPAAWSPPSTATRPRAACWTATRPIRRSTATSWSRARSGRTAASSRWPRGPSSARHARSVRLPLGARPRALTARVRDRGRNRQAGPLLRDRGRSTRAVGGVLGS